MCFLFQACVVCGGCGRECSKTRGGGGLITLEEARCVSCYISLEPMLSQTIIRKSYVAVSRSQVPFV